MIFQGLVGTGAKRTVSRTFRVPLDGGLGRGVELKVTLNV